MEKIVNGGRWTQRMLTLGVCALAIWMGGCGPNTSPNSRQDLPAGDSPNAARTSWQGTRHDLSIDENRGGHTLDRHVGRTDDELRERLERERNISAASTWTDREAAEETVGEALQANRGRIESWQSRGYPRPNLALHFDAGKVIGRSIRHGESAATPCTAAVVVLKANGPDSFIILTTYPEARD